MTTAQYTFLPWLRRGVVSLASADRVEPTARLAVALQLQVTGEGEETRTEPISQTARLYGPGDVTGIDWSAIVRTTPHSGVHDFEANFLASIEFYDEDFLWRYTPAVAQGGQLQPWLWLVVLEAGEYTRQGVSAGRLPVIDIAPEALKNAFPPPGQDPGQNTTWAWAHVHLNFALPVQPDPLTEEARNEVRTVVTQKLDNNPNLGCSRLLCPRRLKANTRYTACLIPAFAKGRLAGIGAPEAEIDATPNTQASWPAKDAVSGAVQFPVYYEWEFSTTDAGDFEDLARLLRPLDPKELDPDANLLDLQEPGWGLRYRSTPGRKQPGAVVLEGALRIPGVASDLAFGKDAADAAFLKALSDLLNLGVEPVADQSSLPPANKKTNPFFGANLDDDPVVVPPLYGSFYRQDKKLNPATPLLWYNQLNSNPVYRVAAGQGTAVVQHNQEEYIDRAWDQLHQHIETRALVQRWQFSLHASQAFFAKRLASSLSITINSAEPDTTSQDVQRFRMVNMAAPLHTRLKLASSSFASSIRSSKFGAVYSSAFAKLTRSSGPLMRRFKDREETRPATLFFNVPLPGAVEEAVEEAVEHRDLTGPSGFPRAVGDPAAYVTVDGFQHVIYRDGNGNLHELWWTTEDVGHGDLTGPSGFPRAVGDPAAYVTADGFQHVIYRDGNGNLHELWWTTDVGHGDLTGPSGFPRAASDPAAYATADGFQHVIYREGNGNVHALRWTTGAVEHRDLTGPSDFPRAVGDPAAYATASGFQFQHVIYREGNGNVHALQWTMGGAVEHRDLTGPSGFPRAVGDLAAYATADGPLHVIYRDVDGNVHELRWTMGGGVEHRDLTGPSDFPRAVGDPAAYATADGFQHVIYRGGDGNVHELRRDTENDWPGSPLEKVVTAAFNVVNQGGMDILNSLLQQNGLVGLDACKKALERLQRSFQRFDILIFPLPKNNELYISIASQIRPAKTIPTRLRAMFATTTSQANLEAERIDLARETVEFSEPMYHALAERSPDYIIPTLAGIPSDRVTILVPNDAFIEAYLLGLNHEMAREFLWREFPVNLDGTFFRQFWDVRDNPKAAEEPASFKDITPVSGWGTTELGSPDHRPDGIAEDVLVVVMRSELLRKYPYTEVFMQKAVWTKEPNTQRDFREADFSKTQYTIKPFFSARIAPDFILLGFNLVLSEAIGSLAPQDNNPGWYFALKERPGDVHFGMDLKVSTTDPSWPALEEVLENQCINAASQQFKNLPRYGGQADKIAAMLYQRPFVLYVHASRLLPGN